jgi:uncharacterized protein
MATKKTYRTPIPVSANALYEWHARPGAFERLSPPWRRVEVAESRGGIEPGDGKRLELPLLGPFAIEWDLEHEPLQDNIGFVDVQRSGPFRQWRHEHRFIPTGERDSILEDKITYSLPLGAFGRVAGARRIGEELDRLFEFRHRRTLSDLTMIARYAIDRPLRVAISGSTGLVGERLISFLETGGHEVVRIVRGTPDAVGDVRWDPSRGEIDAAALEGLDAVVHLAGESIAGGWWTGGRKQRIIDSRVQGTGLLASTLASLERPPRVFVSTSAIGYYGDGGDQVLTESAPNGDGFLASVTRAWESAAEPASRAGIRVVHPRLGIVLAGEGGMLPLISLPFRMGMGGPIGGGSQFMSWIALDDLVRVLYWSIVNESLSGPVNAVAPQAVTNIEFARTLAGVLRRPSFFRVPGPIARVAGGQLAEELILVSQRVAPHGLVQSGFSFDYPTIEQALRHELARFESQPVLTTGDATAAVAGD